MESTLESFLNKEKLEGLKPDYKGFQLISTETYNELEIYENIQKIGKEVCGAIAIQLAIIGYGNKKYGSLKINEKIVDIEQFFTSNNINTKFELGSKLQPGTITPRRLIRIYRYTIQDYLLTHPLLQSYLYKKYCYDKVEENRCCVYPGFENIAVPGVDDKKVVALLKVYRNVDEKKKNKYFWKNKESINSKRI